MMWYWGGGVHWWGWLLGTVGMVAFWGIIIWAIWYFATAVTRRPEQTRGPGETKAILDERLARGEIGAEEYRRLRDLIRGGDGTDILSGGGSGTATHGAPSSEHAVGTGERR